MSSPLDLTGNATDDGGKQKSSPRRPTKARRDKRHSQVMLTATNSSSPDSDSALVVSTPRLIVNFLGDLFFVMIFNVVMLVFKAMARSVSLVFGGSGNVFMSAEENRILRELPGEQRQQKRELEYLSGSQEQQRQQVDELRRRVQKIEERRKAMGYVPRNEKKK